MSTHPDPSDRYKMHMRDAAKWQDDLDISPWKVNADDYLHLLDGLHGEIQQGFVEGQMFYHPEMKLNFRFPIASINDRCGLRMYTPDGKAIMISLPRREHWRKPPKLTLPQLEVNLLESKRTTVNGMPAVSAISYQASQFRQVSRIPLCYVLFY